MQPLALPGLRLGRPPLRNIKSRLAAMYHGTSVISLRPSDDTAAFQDFAGTPADESGEPLAFLANVAQTRGRPWAQYVAGLETITIEDVLVPGGYDNTIDTWSQDGYESSAGTTASRVIANFTTVVGRWYRVKHTWSAIGGAAPTVYPRSGWSGAGATLGAFQVPGASAAPTENHVYFKATTTQSSLLWVAGTTSAVDMVVTGLQIVDLGAGHFTQPSATVRPELDITDGVSSIYFNGLTHSTIGLSGVSDKSDITIVMAVKIASTDVAFVLLSDASGGALFIGRGESGNANTAICNGAGANVVISVDGVEYVNGVASRGDLKSALADDTIHIVTITGVDFTSWTDADVARYAAAPGTYEVLGGISPADIIPNADFADPDAVLALSVVDIKRLVGVTA